MQLGFVSAILPEQSLEEVFAIAKEIGYQTVEVMCWPVGRSDRRYAGVTHIDVAAREQVRRDNLDFIRTHGVTSVQANVVYAVAAKPA